MIASSERAGSFAAMFNERPECAVCPRVEVRALSDGHLEHSFKLPRDVDPFAPSPDRGNGSMRFDGHQVWFFTYFAPHHSDVLGTSEKERCSYGREAALTRKRRGRMGIATRVIPTGDGGALALAIDDAAHATLAKLAAPP